MSEYYKPTRFDCSSCGRMNYDTYNFCPYCGTEITEIFPRPRKVHYRRRVNGDRYSVKSVRALLQPLIDLNGLSWVARRIGDDESNLRRRFKQSSISERVVERWLIKMNLENALYDGTLELLPDPRIPESPPSQYFEE